jgi:FlaG/FlaF family flagellin (archaellin)
MKKLLVISHSVRRSGSWVIRRAAFEKRYIIVYFSLFTFHFSLSQTTLQVVTKTAEKTFSTEHIAGLNFQAERADVEVVVWNKSEIKIITELTAKHPDRAIATADLENLKYGIEQVGKTLYCRNYLMVSKGTTKPQANLKVRFVVLMPATCALNVQNSFGKIQIKGLTKEATLNTDFCSTDLTNMAGKITISTHFGELRLTDIDGQITLTTDHSDTWLKQLKGQCNIRAQGGSIEINTDKAALKLNLKTDKTEVRYAAQSLVIGH